MMDSLCWQAAAHWDYTTDQITLPPLGEHGTTDDGFSFSAESGEQLHHSYHEMGDAGVQDVTWSIGGQATDIQVLNQNADMGAQQLPELFGDDSVEAGIRTDPSPELRRDVHSDEDSESDENDVIGDLRRMESVRTEQDKAQELRLLRALNIQCAERDLQQHASSRFLYPPMQNSSYQMRYRDDRSFLNIAQADRRMTEASRVTDLWPVAGCVQINRVLTTGHFDDGSLFDSCLRNIKHYTVIPTRQSLDAIQYQQFLDVDAFTAGLIRLILGTHPGRLIRQLLSSLRTLLHARFVQRELQVLLAENTFWLFTVFHDRWLIHDSGTYADDEPIPYHGPQYLIGMRHFGDTRVLHTMWTGDAKSLMYHAFLRVAGDMQRFLQQTSMCELIYIALAAIFTRHANELTGLTTQSSWMIDAFHVSRHIMGRSFPIIQGARNFANINLDPEYITQLCEERVRTSQGKRKSAGGITWEPKRTLPATCSVVQDVPRVPAPRSNANRGELNYRDMIPKVMSHLFMRPQRPPLRPCKDQELFVWRMRWMMPVNSSEMELDPEPMMDVSIPRLPQLDSDDEEPEPARPAGVAYDPANLSQLIKEEHMSLLFLRDTLFQSLATFVRPVPISDMARSSELLRQLPLQEYRIRWLTPMLLHRILGQPLQVNHPKDLEWSKETLHTQSTASRVILAGVYQQLVSLMGARQAVAPTMLYDLYHAWARMYDANVSHFYWTLREAEEAHLLKLTRASTRLLIATGLSTRYDDALLAHISLESPLPDTFPEWLESIPYQSVAFDSLWTMSRVVVQVGSDPQRLREVLRQHLSGGAADWSAFEGQSALVADWTTEVSQTIFISELPMWWERQQAQSAQLMKAFWVDAGDSSLVINADPENHWMSEFAMGTAEHVSHTLLAHITQSVEQFVDRVELTRLMAVCCASGSTTQVKDETRSRLQALLQVIAPAISTSSALRNLADMADSCQPPAEHKSSEVVTVDPDRESILNDGSTGCEVADVDSLSLQDVTPRASKMRRCGPTPPTTSVSAP